MNAAQPACPGPGSGWLEQGWCCLACAVLAHPAWCRHDNPGQSDRPRQTGGPGD
ncbi:MAG: hypothetical protein J2P26_09110 [Nocardiopsaceae bacterium]|nr:hypothetical protein [Nocardiopsaceae bacterium]